MTALAGFTSSFAVVLAGRRAVGATPAPAASGQLALTPVFGVGVLWLSWRGFRRRSHGPRRELPLLAGAGTVDGGWPAAVGAFLVTGVLIGLSGLSPALAGHLAQIPTSLVTMESQNIPGVAVHRSARAWPT